MSEVSLVFCKTVKMSKYLFYNGLSVYPEFFTSVRLSMPGQVRLEVLRPLPQQKLYNM